MLSILSAQVVLCHILMKFFLLLSVFLSASMTPVPEDHVSYRQCAPVDEVSCIVESYFLCPPGYLDGCLSGETKNHKCVLVQDGPTCETDFDLKCPENFEDGCLSGETQAHTCIPVKGKLCKESSELICPIGFEDSCLK